MLAEEEEHLGRRLALESSNPEDAD
jgi:hypothetical protein